MIWQSSFRLVAVFLFIICTLPGCSAFVSSSPVEGTPHLIDLQGKTHALGEYFGEHTLLILWASWCPECVVELSSLNIVKRNLAARDIKVVAVAVNDDLNAVRECPPVRAADYSILVDVKDQVRMRYPLASLPAVYLLNHRGEPVPLLDPEDGKPKTSVVGFREWQSKAGTRAIIDSVSPGEH